MEGYLYCINKLVWLEISIILVFIDFISCSSIFLQSIVPPFPSPGSADAMGCLKLEGNIYIQDALRKTDVW